MAEPDPLSVHEDLAVLPWGEGAMLRREGDDLNEPQAMVLSPEEWRWLFMYGAAEANRLLNPAPDLRSVPASSTQEPTAPQTPNDQGAQASLMEDQ